MRIKTLLLMVLAPGSMAAQRGLLACPAEYQRPYFGWSSTDCGNCNIYGTYMEYLTEPTIRDIRRGGPGDGKLQESDVLVAVDGNLITTSDAWRRLRDTRPGDNVRLTVRRGGSEVTTTIVAGLGECRAPSPRVGRVLTVPMGRLGIASRAGANARAAIGRVLPRGWLGVGISCNDACVASRSGLSGPMTWRFTEPPRVTFVDPDGPAGRAGLERDDIIMAINGIPITDREAGRLFGGAAIGSDLQVTVLRGASKRTLTIRTEELPDDAVERARRAAIVPRDFVMAFPSGRGFIGGRAGGRSYTVGDAVVDIEGGAVNNVQFDERTGELVIRAGGTVIRVKPRRQ
jgi:S1-C subfamily serine protease